MTPGLKCSGATILNVSKRSHRVAFPRLDLGGGVRSALLLANHSDGVLPPLIQSKTADVWAVVLRVVILV